jgi:hypothetical protein
MKVKFKDKINISLHESENLIHPQFWEWYSFQLFSFPHCRSTYSVIYKINENLYFEYHLQDLLQNYEACLLRWNWRPILCVLLRHVAFILDDGLGEFTRLYFTFVI